MPEVLPIDAHDPRGVVAVEHRHDLADPPLRERAVAVPEAAGREALVAIQEDELTGPTRLDVRAHRSRVVGVQERETWLARDRIPQQGPQLLVTEQVDLLVRIGERVAVVRCEDDECVARWAVAEGALE